MLDQLDDFVSNGSQFVDYRTKELGQQLGKASADDVLSFLLGRNKGVQKEVTRQTAGLFGKNAYRMASKSPVFQNMARVVPGLTAAVTALDVADVLAGDDSFGNKVMDAGSMALGGGAGLLLGGPMGAMVGASGAKALSDSAQAIFGGGKSAEQRRMEEALAALRGGQI